MESLCNCKLKVQSHQRTANSLMARNRQRTSAAYIKCGMAQKMSPILESHVLIYHNARNKHHKLHFIKWTSYFVSVRYLWFVYHAAEYQNRILNFQSIQKLRSKNFTFDQLIDKNVNVPDFGHSVTVNSETNNCTCTVTTTANQLI